MADLQSTLDAVMSLDAISRKMLLDILQKRQIEERREEIAGDAQKNIKRISFRKAYFFDVGRGV
ncbi:hypothetical protein [Pararcticibacter amylolyticus]|uniref:Uncharacterized protein n=1 Tax=Pararcticibacter amylolyticus TaxID=2173175 RepID=A0A2U2PFI3_9SPHI|nr:hypothetical protein [Pararcticibacter amylolyticus]PWG80165.1 hypothetical protein DDR33_13290 [Pararcticibacter amylolyticus]